MTIFFVIMKRARCHACYGLNIASSSYSGHRCSLGAGWYYFRVGQLWSNFSITMIRLVWHSAGAGGADVGTLRYGTVRNVCTMVVHGDDQKVYYRCILMVAHLLHPVIGDSTRRRMSREETACTIYGWHEV